MRQRNAASLCSLVSDSKSGKALWGMEARRFDSSSVKNAEASTADVVRLDSFSVNSVTDVVQCGSIDIAQSNIISPSSSTQKSFRYLSGSNLSFSVSSLIALLS